MIEEHRKSMSVMLDADGNIGIVVQVPTVLIVVPREVKELKCCEVLTPAMERLEIVVSTSNVAVASLIESASSVFSALKLADDTDVIDKFVRVRRDSKVNILPPFKTTLPGIIVAKAASWNTEKSDGKLASRPETMVNGPVATSIGNVIEVQLFKLRLPVTLLSCAKCRPGKDLALFASIVRSPDTRRREEKDVPMLGVERRPSC
jgi:hypothetical protein